MPEYLAPGVFVEEVSFRAKSIEGVGTSVAGIVGPTRTGPLRGKPEVVTSFARFTQVYGDAADLDLGGSAVLNHTAIAARAFFENGGKQLFVVRVANGNTPPAVARSRAAITDLRFEGRFPGAMGGYTLELNWRDSDNLLQVERTTAPAPDEVVFLEATGVPEAVQSADLAAAIPAERFPLGIRALVRRRADHYEIDAGRAVFDTADGETLDAAAFARQADGVMALMTEDGIGAAASLRLTRVLARAPASGPLDEGTSAELRLAEEADLSAFTGAPHWGTLRALRGTLNAAGTVLSIPVSEDLNPGLTQPVTLPLAALAAAPGAATAVVVQRAFDIDVLTGAFDDLIDGDGEVVYSFSGMTAAASGATSMATVMAATPERREAQLTQPVACVLGADVDGAQVHAALYALFEPDGLNPSPRSPRGPRYLIRLGADAATAGSDGDPPVAIDYIGATNEQQGSTGFAALEDIEDVSIVLCPAAAAHPSSHEAVVSAMWAHCNRMRYRIGIVDAREGMALSEVRALASQFPSNRLALYYPWIVTIDPTGRHDSITVPPAGFIAGIYANTDVTRGVHKAPANEPIIGALRLAQDINRFQQELLNPNGINCLRSFPGGGHRVWGGRTLDVRDPEWKYVNVRRYFLYLERSIERSTQWVVFEPNGERLWANVRSAVEDFLYNEWFNGRLLGGSPKAAYFVRCDRSTMTQNDLDNGRLVCLIGVAPLTPAEFVIFRIGQKTADG